MIVGGQLDVLAGDGCFVDLQGEASMWLWLQVCGYGCKYVVTAATPLRSDYIPIMECHGWQCGIGTGSLGLGREQ